jgi:fumarate hydratase class II
MCREDLIPALSQLEAAFKSRAADYDQTIKTGRTHLMDAMPVTVAQEFLGYARQLELGVVRVKTALESIAELPMGGTAVGTGVNTHPEFPELFATEIAALTGCPFREAKNHFEAQSSLDSAVELSGNLKTVSVSMMKIANDLRWMNSGPNCGLSEIELPVLQPGSSIMPGKVNPVIEESVAMVCAQVIGLDQAITVAGLSGNFELNVMLPLVAYNLIESIRFLSNAARNWAQKSIPELRVRKERVRLLAERNPILVTALNRRIGYDKAAKIARAALDQDRPVIDVALELTDLTREELEELLDPVRLTVRGFPTG